MLGSVPCSKNTADGPTKWLFLKKKKKTMGVLHYLMIMNTKIMRKILSDKIRRKLLLFLMMIN